MLLRAVAREDRSRPERLRREEGAVEHLACAATPPDKVPASRRPREQSHLRSGGDRRGAARGTLDTDARYCAPASDPDGDGARGPVNSVTTPPGVILPTAASFASGNQTLPSGPATRLESWLPVMP